MEIGKQQRTTSTGAKLTSNRNAASSRALPVFFETLKTAALQRNDKYMYHTMFPLYEMDLTYQNMELFLEVKEDIMTLSREYLQNAKQSGEVMVGVHLRRGDHKYYNCNKRVEKLQGAKGQQVLDQ